MLSHFSPISVLHSRQHFSTLTCSARSRRSVVRYRSRLIFRGMIRRGAISTNSPPGSAVLKTFSDSSSMTAKAVLLRLRPLSKATRCGAERAARGTGQENYGAGRLRVSRGRPSGPPHCFSAATRARPGRGRGLLTPGHAPPGEPRENRARAAGQHHGRAQALQPDAHDRPWHAALAIS